MAKGRLVNLLTVSMSRRTAAVLRNSDPMPPSPPSLDTAAANSAEVQVPIGARMIGTSIPSKSQSGVLSMGALPSEIGDAPSVILDNDTEKWVPVFGKRSCSTKKARAG